MRFFASRTHFHHPLKRISRTHALTASRLARSLAAAACLALTACGGGGGGSTATTPTTPVAVNNTVPMMVDSGPAAASGVINQPYVSVTICAPGTTTCQTIDHVLVDTGSYGLRIIAPGLLDPSISLPAVQTSAGAAVGECVKFTSGYTWGSVKLADVKLGGEVASRLPINIVGDTSATFATTPSACSSGASNLGTVAKLGANGILGIGVFKEDCGNNCASSPASGQYYACTGTTCSSTSLPLVQQVSNPVAAFPQDNNGVILVLPSVPAGGLNSVAGSLIFGIGTQANNAFASETVYATNNVGNFTTTYKGKVLGSSYLDSGSNGYYFPDSTIALCSNSTGFYCPAGALSLSAVNTAADGKTSSTVSFNVENVDSLAAAVSAASVGGTASSNTFDWGLPFFFGRRVFVAIENAGTPKGTGPYWAY
ncbi:DUF3443 domain-containing protein [Undibacterium sp.]|jgi:hypothetical protein|uniref:DUF3443 domain-containing protein n=1 Tax=Undibacterium sp. TaxID=1914977 RepID=UPI002D1106FF|nr:DUF3443 domain-containing protein [Undibacterium sp.]HTD06154.1 DUF3443 domain-containing protein [Undibacterium sp.]